MSDTRLSVLVVDDDHDTADTLTTLLHLTGYRARAAYGGIEAQRMAAEEWPDVVILDLLMPGVDGFELAYRLHPLPPGRRPRLIAVTGYPTAGGAQRRPGLISTRSSRSGWKC